jgi:hypothetical protein
MGLDFCPVGRPSTKFDDFSNFYVDDSGAHNLDLLEELPKKDTS